MSRLEDNSVQTREFLESRNLYTPNDPYNISGTDTTDVIRNIASVVNPFGTTVTTIASRLLEGQTPLTAIGLEMLAKQFTYTAASNAAAEYLPAIKFDNLFDGDPDTKFIMLKKDYQITRRETQGNVGKILEEISGNYPLKGNPFDRDSSNIDFIDNSGKGQLQLLFGNLNRNKFLPSNLEVISKVKEIGIQYPNNLDIRYNSVYFAGVDEIFYPYNQYKVSRYVDIFGINKKLNVENQLYIALNSDSDGYGEYGSTQNFIKNLGKTNNINNNDGAGDYLFEDSAERNYGLEDDPTQRLIWGRDGVDNNYKSTRSDESKLGIEPDDNGGTTPKTSRFDFKSREESFDLNAGGLLSYTRELLNSKGEYSMFDLTKKKFLDVDNQLHFNGSPLTKRNDGQLDKNRQHNVTDPYDKYVKAIRWNGNKIYEGNQNSVIYNNVIPKIHPFVDGNEINNKNMMFSIENLAFEVYPDEQNNYGLVQDEEGTELPLCEVGSNGGRVMWFPPYDINVTENVIIHRETTNFIGRGEPIYTYSNTERIANLSFKLLIDYPPNINGMDQVEASRFFAFGGNAPVGTSNLGDKVRKKEELTRQREEITKEKKQARPKITQTTLDFFFINDEPKIGAEAGAVQNHYDKNYEINAETVPDESTPDGRNHDLNITFKNQIDTLINDYLLDENNSEFTKLVFKGSASTLFLGDNGEEYNEELSNRRMESILKFIEKRYNILSSGTTFQQAAFTLEGLGRGSGGVGGTNTDDAAEIPSDEAKAARKASITFADNGKSPTEIVPQTTTDIENVKSLDEEIQVLETNIINQKKINNANCTFTPYTIEDGVLKGFNSSQNDKYKPIFHSQTPEDFHRRLTFLHQCTRQGNAIRKSRGDGNTFSASNSVFGRQPVQILRIGDMFHTKVVIDNMQIDFTDSPWDMNPEGMGMQFMIADIKLQLKLVGGQSLQTPINALQNAVSFNYYANSTFYNSGIYEKPSKMEAAQMTELFGVQDTNGNAVVAPESEAITEIPSLSSFKPPNVSI